MFQPLCRNVSQECHPTRWAFVLPPKVGEESLPPFLHDGRRPGEVSLPRGFARRTLDLTGISHYQNPSLYMPLPFSFGVFPC